MNLSTPVTFSSKKIKINNFKFNQLFNLISLNLLCVYQ